MPHDENAVCGLPTRLFDEHRQPSHLLEGDLCGAEIPPAIGISHDQALPFRHIHDSTSSRRIVVGIVTDLELKTMDPRLLALDDELGHLLRAPQRHRLIEREVVLENTPEQCRNGETCRLAQEIPAGNIDCRPVSY